MDFLPILKTIVTVGQANDLLLELENLSKSIYLTGNKFSGNLKKIDVRYYDQLFYLLEKNDKKECLRKLVDAIKKLPVINLNLSFFPSFEIVEKISDWLEESMGEKVLISIKKNPELFTKIELEYQGRYVKC
jgi:hypothetical protein